MRKLCLIPIICMTILSLAACSKGAGSQNGSGAELSTEMQHKYLESCDCPTDANGVKQHAGSCDVRRYPTRWSLSRTCTRRT